jgi:pimeloyl-ACP methyl ester carboxylesterase
MSIQRQQLTASHGIAAGVPYVALAPADEPTAPLIVIWHLGSPPRSESAMAAALPMRGLPAWRVYLGLPLLGGRLPDGGLDEWFRLLRDDMVLNVFEPAVREAVQELGAALAELRSRLPIADAPLGLVAGSMGAWVAQSVLTDTDLRVSAAALVSPAISMSSVVGRYERMWDFAYPWSERSRDVAMLLAVGALGDEQGFRDPAKRLHEALARRSPVPASLVAIPRMEHALAEEPGLEPAPQTAQAAQVEAVLVDWFSRHLDRHGLQTEPADE